MMLPRDFRNNHNPGETDDMPAELQDRPLTDRSNPVYGRPQAEQAERTPGVYVRAEQELPHELDMLWSNSRMFQREERSPVLSFVAGLVLGILLTTAVFTLIINQPKIATGVDAVMAPIGETVEKAMPKAAAPKASVDLPNAPRATAPAGNATSYVVQSGDTLGGIASKVYGSSSPDLVNKIQAANNMSSPDALQIDQKLVIPPKSY